MEPIRLKKNEFWGRRSGKYDARTPKGCVSPTGFCIYVRRGRTYAGRTTATRPKSPGALLAKQAMDRGFLNGHRLARADRTGAIE